MAPTSPPIPRLFAEARREHLAGRLAEAELLYRRILATDPGHADSLHLLGVIAHQSGHHVAAAELIAGSIAIDGTVAEYHANLGNVFARLGRLDEAIAAHRTALGLRPDSADMHFNLGNALTRQGRLDEAIETYRTAVALKPDYWEAHTHLGNALRDLRRLDEAVASFRRAIAVKPDFAELHSNLSAALREQGRLQEAAACCRTAIALNPDLPEAHYNLATALLSLGDLADGFREYEWRWQTREARGTLRTFGRPQWHGEPAAGRTLLVHAEQGFGDTLQFCRYVLVAAARGLRVILAVKQPLVRLLRCLPGVERVIGQGEDPGDIDLQCPLLSMPLALGTTLATIPSATCYLRADPAQVAVLRARLCATGRQGRRVGLAWAGSHRAHALASAAIDRRRSIPPMRLAPLFDVPGLQFVSLQKDGPAAPAGAALIDLMPEMADFADSAALIENLDLVISVDTAVAHLAAALGKPVWLLDRFDPCWRWLAGRRDSPWYPTLRIYRQPKPGDWESVIAEVAADLRGFGA